jgi:hypothetical protein
MAGRVPGVLECTRQSALMHRKAQVPVRRRHQRVPHRWVGVHVFASLSAKGKGDGVVTAGVRPQRLHGLRGEIECHAHILPSRCLSLPWETS